MDGVDEVTDEIEGEVDRRMQALRDDPEQLRRYDLYGDGQFDDEKWAELRQVISLEVQTERRRGQEAVETTSEEGEDLEVLRDRFELRGVLGRGAQGRTYLGWDRDREQNVAVKELLLRDVEDWKAIELFEREGEALKYLDHPGIPHYVDAFHFQEEGRKERFFLVQEYVDGSDFKTLVDQGMTLTEEEAGEFLDELLQILVYLQDRSPPVIHRDIKPSNVMRHSDGRLALIDFGAVQSVLPKAGGGSTIIGTSGYMPVEQLMGRAQPATDLYAVGATVVHLLSRRHPADLPMEEMRLKFSPYVNVSDDFEAYLQTLLEPHVEARFSTAEEALQALRNLDERSSTPQPTRTPGPTSSAAASESPAVEVDDSLSVDVVVDIEDSEPGPEEESSDGRDLMRTDQRPWWQDGKFVELVIIVVVLLFVFGVVGIAAFNTYQEAQVTPADECQRGDHYACVTWGQEVEERDPDEAARAYAMGCELDHVTACFNQGVMALRRGDFDEATAPLNKACDLEDASACTNLAAILDADDPSAEEAAERACELGSYLGCANYANTFLWRFEDAMVREDSEEAQTMVRRAWRYADRGCRGESENGCYRLALAELYQGNLDEAIRSAQRALALNDRHPHTHQAYGLALAAEGDVDGAIQSLQSALDAAQNPGGDERPVFVDPVANTRSDILRRLAILERLYPEQTQSLVEVYQHFGE